MNLIDIHAHITKDVYEDLTEMIARAKENGVNKIVCSSYDVQSALGAIEAANQFENVFANIGIHPQNIYDVNLEFVLDKFEELAKEKKVIAIGEIGLDYHWDKENKPQQKSFFEGQIEFANKLDLPIVVHSRDAMADTIEILKNNPLKKESLLHCFAGSVESAKILMDLGFSFSFGGVLTFKNAQTAVEVVKFLPLERILIETDCPYLTPEPFRGKKNEPKNIVYIADKISKIKNVSLDEVARVTNENAKRIFGI